MVCPPVQGDNPRAVASGLSLVQADKPWYNYYMQDSEEANRLMKSFSLLSRKIQKYVENVHLIQSVTKYLCQTNSRERKITTVTKAKFELNLK